MLWTKGARMQVNLGSKELSFVRNYGDWFIDNFTIDNKKRMIVEITLRCIIALSEGLEYNPKTNRISWMKFAVKNKMYRLIYDLIHHGDLLRNPGAAINIFFNDYHYYAVEENKWFKYNDPPLQDKYVMSPPLVPFGKKKPDVSKIHYQAILQDEPDGTKGSLCFVGPSLSWPLLFVNYAEKEEEE